MRKILIMLFIFGTANAYAQSPGTPTTSMTVAEANKLNGTAQPTINGMPYSQYKAQQDALKNKAAAKQETAPSLQVTAINAEDLKNLRKEEKQQAATSAPVTAAKSATAQYADKTIPGTLFQATGATISTANTQPATLQSAATPVKATQTPVAKPATSKQASGN